MELISNGKVITINKPDEPFDSFWESIADKKSIHQDPWNGPDGFIIEIDLSKIETWNM